MFAAFSHVHWLAVVASTFSCTVLGGLWFALLVPKSYAVALGRENSPPHKQAPVDYVAQMTCTFCNVLTSAILLAALHVDNVPDALVFGALVGVGYLVAMTVNIAVNPNFPRPFFYGAVNGPYFFLCSLLTSAILVTL